jgi:hypothetical protein
MSIHWGSLLLVFVVSFGSAVAVVALVTLGLLGLSARGAQTVPATSTGRPTGPDAWSPRTGTALAVAGLGLAALLVLLGLWEIVAR